LSEKKGTLCPNCGTDLTRPPVIRYGTPFRCLNCNTLLEVPTSYNMVCGWLSAIIAAGLCLAAGLRNLSLIAGFLVALLPVMFSVSFFQRHLFPPKLTVHPH
jgi:hypothetical protein